MNRIISATILFILSFSAYSEDKCSFENLTKYSLTIIVENPKAEYHSTILLPDIKKINEEFCGYWESQELTNGKNVQYYGYKSENSYITLNPELYDQGFSIDLTNNNEWPQSGKLIKMGIVGSIAGSFKIEK